MSLPVNTLFSNYLSNFLHVGFSVFIMIDVVQPSTLHAISISSLWFIFCIIVWICFLEDKSNHVSFILKNICWLPATHKGEISVTCKTLKSSLSLLLDPPFLILHSKSLSFPSSDLTPPSGKLITEHLSSQSVSWLFRSLWFRIWLECLPFDFSV